MNATPVRFALVGAGVIGAVHARALSELTGSAALAVVVDRDAARARALAERYPGVEDASDLRAVLSRPDIDAVSICLPTGLHATTAVASLEAGKHVVLEKPIDVTLAGADRIIQAEQRSGRVVTVISQHRFDPSTERVLGCVRDGTLGTITSGIASHAWWRGQSYYDSGEWRGTRAMDGGGATINQTVHTIDLLLTIVGTPVEVFAYTARLAHERIEVEDTAVAVVRFASGALGIIHATTAAYPGLDARLSVYGTKGSAVISDDRLVFLHQTHGDAPEIAMSEGTGQNQVTPDDLPGPAAGGLGRAHRAQLEDFVDAVTRGRPPRRDPRGEDLPGGDPGDVRVGSHREAGPAVTSDARIVARRARPAGG
jgi:UDP-N-acetyl-2-amino-2-deoxyglucuronate dehydrogenase